MLIRANLREDSAEEFRQLIYIPNRKFQGYEEASMAGVRIGKDMRGRGPGGALQGYENASTAGWAERRGTSRLADSPEQHKGLVGQGTAQRRRPPSLRSCRACFVRAC